MARPRRLWIFALVLASLCAPVAARADTNTAAAIQVLRELTELHVRQFDVFCIPHLDMQAMSPPPNYEVTVGWARIRGAALYLDRTLVCGPLEVYYTGGTIVRFTHPLLLALEAVAGTYGFTLGLKRYFVAECYAARVVWKWVLRSNPAPSDMTESRVFLLNNSYRPPGYKLKPSCTLTMPPAQGA